MYFAAEVVLKVSITIMLLLALTLTVYSTLFCGVPAVPTTVDLKYSQYVGEALPNGVSQWLGMRFAAPPVGNLRFAPPQDPLSTSGPQAADQHGKLCLATADSPTSDRTSEDCLFLDVYAPTDADSDSKLPVYLFIQGGGFNADANPNLDGSGLVQASGNELIVVTFNYRVGPYGFATDDDLIGANNGLLDQRKAMEWVQRHISSFGGNPDHVVLGGASAGAASISLHLTAYGGRNDGLFHGAAAESVSFATVLTAEESTYQWDSFSKALGCTGDSQEVLDCMRSKTASELQEHNTNMPYPGQSMAPLFMWNPAIDGDFLRDVTYNSFQNGKFIKHIPLIAGSDSNDGTIFTPRGTSSLDESDVFLRAQFPYLTDSMISGIEQMYPNPDFRKCPGDGCYWRQLSNAYGEMRYMCPGLYVSGAVGKQDAMKTRRNFASSFTARRAENTERSSSGKTTSWAYRYNVEDQGQIAQGLGVPHTSEIHAIFGPSCSGGGAPWSYYKDRPNAEVVDVVQAYWISFIRSFDPNTYRKSGSAEWKPYYDSSSTGPQRLVFETGGETQMEAPDLDLQVRCAYFANIGAAIKQ